MVVFRVGGVSVLSVFRGLEVVGGERVGVCYYDRVIWRVIGFGRK